MSTDLNIELVESFYDAAKSQQLFDELLKYEYEKLQMNFNGKNFIPQRKVLGFGDTGVNYAFSGTCVFAKPWTPTLLAMKKDVERKTGQDYNFALLNFYPNGNAKIAAHKDDEKDLNPASIIPTLSLGATRIMKFTQTKFKPSKVPLASGSLLLMKPPTNKFWTHAIPAEPAVTEPRISVTFRNIVERGQDIVEHPYKPPSRKRSFDEAIPEDDWLTRLYAPAKKTSECLKDWDLGFGFKVSLQQMNSRLFVHMRQYSAQGENFYPTNQGIVMNMDTFQDFHNKLFHVNTKYSTSSVICNNQLLILSYKGELVLKQLFQFQLKETFLSVDEINLIKIKELIPDICETIKDSLLTILQTKILVECKQNVNIPPNIDLFHEYVIALQHEIECNILKLFRCDGCALNDMSQGNHACMTVPLQDQSWCVGDDAIFVLNVNNIIETLRSKNVIQYFHEDFFKCISWSSLNDHLKL